MRGARDRLRPPFAPNALAVLVAVTACGSGLAPTIRASSYDQTCAEPGDCVGVNQVDFGSAESACCMTDCGAINRGDLSRYDADFARDALTLSEGACAGVTCPSTTTCATLTVTCIQGVCGVETP